MFSTLPFETHADEYENWFDKYKVVFESEVEAIRSMLPVGKLHGVEVGLATGRFSSALGIKEGIEPALEMREMALKRGIDVKDAIAEKLPYDNLQYDFVLMVSCVSYFTNIELAFREANRVLKESGTLIVGFIDKNSIIGKFYEERRQKSVFYKQATFYTPEQIKKELSTAGFGAFTFSQTLFENLDEIKELEPSIPGYGKGSFVVVKAIKEK